MLFRRRERGWAREVTNRGFPQQETSHPTVVVLRKGVRNRNADRERRTKCLPTLQMLSEAAKQVLGKRGGETVRPLQPGSQSNRKIRRETEGRGGGGITLLGRGHQKRGEGAVGAAHYECVGGCV